MKATRTLWFGILVWLLYIALRTLIQRLIPITDYPSSLRQDEVITLFRLLCGLAVVALYWRCWTLKELLQWKRIGAWVWMGGFLLFASHLANALAGQQPAWFDWRVIGIDLVVGFNEEVAFRGLFQRALSEWKGLGWGEWLGALMFTAMHLGYEPLSEMVYIFLWGLGAAKLRSRGAAIGFLIGVHWLSDSAYVVCWRTSALPHHWLVWARVACLVGVFGAVWLDKRKNGALSAARA